MVCYQGGDKTGELGWRVRRKVKVIHLFPWPALPVGVVGGDGVGKEGHSKGSALFPDTLLVS